MNLFNRYKVPSLLFGSAFLVKTLLNPQWPVDENRLFSIFFALLCMIVFIEVSRLIMRGIDKAGFAGRFSRRFGTIMFYFVMIFFYIVGSGEIEKRNFDALTMDVILENCKNPSNVEMCEKIAINKRYKDKQYIEAIKIYGLSCRNGRLSSCNSGAWMVAQNHLQSKEFVIEALRLSRILIEKEPNNDHFMDTYAAVLYLNGDKEEAIKYQEKAILKKSNSSREYRLKKYIQGADIESIRY